MALEISTTQATGMTLAATIERLSDGYFWNPVAVAFQNGPAWADKDIALTEGSAENVGTYTASVASLGNAGACRVRIHDTGSSNATIAAGDVYVWGGNEGSLLTTAHDLYTAEIEYIQDDANSQDEYMVTWRKNGQVLTSGITSPTIQVVKWSDGSDLIASTSMTQVGSTGSYKYTATTTARITDGHLHRAIVAATIDSATRTWGRNIGRDD